MIIGLIEGDSEHRKALKRYLLGKQVFSSELARMESRLLAVRQQKIDILQLYDALFSSCEFVQLTRAVFDQATSLRVESNVKRLMLCIWPRRLPVVVEHFARMTNNYSKSL
ncbi:hypothetical protein [Methylotuvimicrobium sp. KM2]|uniref:hypothetical protein n=1 Tax=Methylotuvimicrobium sp. KM2 TaxID=3133976 RepID=UPI00310139F0